jgi:hypothetical protein
MAYFTRSRTEIPVMDRHARAFPLHPEGEPAFYGSLEEAFTTRFDFDAHYTAYQLTGVARRLAGDAWKFGPKMVAFIVDIDGPNHKADDAWWAIEKEKIVALFRARGRGWAHRTRGGARIIWALREDLKIDSPDAARRWSASYLDWLDVLARDHQIEGDRLAKDWTRLFRLPLVVRDGVDTLLAEGDTVGDPKRIGEWDAPYAAADDPRVLRLESTPDVTDAAPVAEDRLEAAARALAAQWPPRARHGASLALCGALALAGWSIEAIADFVHATVVTAGGESDYDKRCRQARSSYDAARGGRETTGWGTLIEAMCTGRDALLDESRRPAVEAAVLAARAALDMSPMSVLADAAFAGVSANATRAALGLVAAPAAGLLADLAVSPAVAAIPGLAEHVANDPTLSADAKFNAFLDWGAEQVQAMSAAGGSAASAPKRYFESYADFRQRDIKPPEWLVRDMLTRGGIAAIAAEPKSAKSWLATEIAIGVASGTPVVGRFGVDRPGSVAYFYAEDHESSVKSHTEALSAPRNLTDPTWYGRLHVQPRGRALDVTKDIDLSVLLASCKALGDIDLLILDPLRDVHSGEEDKSDSMIVVMRRLRGLASALGCSVLFIHHASKSTADTKSRSQGQKMRGSSAVHGAIDCGIYMFDQRGDGKIEFTNGVKSEVKGARSGGTFDLTLHVVDDANGVATSATWTTAERSAEDAVKADPDKVTEVLQRLFDHGAPLTRDALARKLRGGAPVVSAALDDAVRQGLAFARIVDGSQRGGYELTPAGVASVRGSRAPSEHVDTPVLPAGFGGFLAALEPNRN